MFSRIAGRYDLMNWLMTGGMPPRLAPGGRRRRRAAPAGPALDLATGTGDLAFALRQAYPRRFVVGADFSAAMLRHARREAGRRAASGASRCWPPTRWPCPSRIATFACVTSAFLLRNLADLEAGPGARCGA